MVADQLPLSRSSRWRLSTQQLLAALEHGGAGLAGAIEDQEVSFSNR